MKAMVFVMLINLVYIEGAKGSEIARLRGNQVERMGEISVTGTSIGDRGECRIAQSPCRDGYRRHLRYLIFEGGQL
jgi:hypothetical protein